MKIRKLSENRLFNAIFGCFFVLISLFGGVFASTPAVAIREGETLTESEVELVESESNSESELSETESETSNTVSKDSCKNSLGALGWLVCPTTGKISEAVDWLYEKIENILVINPVSFENGSPIYEIWKYCLGVTNIVFVIFLLVVIYSQVTGLGISNYGIKKVLPKIIVVALLVNLSFLICSLAVDVSNIIGNSLRQVFESVETATISNVTSTTDLSLASLYSSLAGGAALAVGATTIAVETGAIWMLIPTALGALVAVVSGLITIALRQAVVILLVMISPLAFVASMLPNTENLFQKWKKALIRMLVFYPTFSLLFGASSLAGWAIISSAQDSFTIMLGIAVQIFPLFFSWSLMKMSGTVLGTINDKMRGLAARPIMANRAWADSHRQQTKMKYLASGRAYTPSLKLMQFVSNRRISRDVETREFAETVKNRGLVYNANSHYKKDGTISKEGERAYEMQARNIAYQSALDRDKHNFNMGIGVYNKKKDRNPYSRSSTTRQARLDALDNKMVEVADNYKYELERGAKIDYENARGFFDRTTNAMNAHYDHKFANDQRYKKHFENTAEGRAAYNSGLNRYNTMLDIMDGDVNDVHFAAAGSAYSLNSQAQIVQGKFQKYFDYTGPTADVVKRLSELTAKNPDKYVDSIVAGLRVLNARGDTDLVRDQILKLASDGVIEGGTYRAQAIANFLMFDVKGNDPNLRRFGKYINMQTAKIFNDNAPGEHRNNRVITFNEYMDGVYDDVDDHGNAIRVESHKGAEILLKGTTFRDVERTAFGSMEGSMASACTTIDDQGRKRMSIDDLIALEKKIDGATFANLASDHLGYLSGSEQINAFATYLTGKKLKNGVYVDDYSILDGIYFETEEERKEAETKLKDFRAERSSAFFGAQVPNQVARAKSDLILPLQKLFEDQAEKEHPGESQEYYTKQAGLHLRKSLQPGVFDSLVKMYHKGYQGDTKANLVALLNLNDPKEVERVLGQNKKKRNDNTTATVRDDEEDEDDGMLISPAEDFDNTEEIQITYAPYRNRISQIYNEYDDGVANLEAKKEDFYRRVCEVIEEIPQFSAQRHDISSLEGSLNSFATVSDIYYYIMGYLGGI